MNSNWSDDSSDKEETLRDFEQDAQLVIDQKVLPAKSLNRYNLVYVTFLKWKEKNKAESFDESVLYVITKTCKKSRSQHVMECVVHDQKDV